MSHSESVPNSVFCRRPFTDLNIEANGTITPCCYIFCSVEGMKKFREKNLQKYLVSDNLKVLKAAMLNGERHAFCQYCWKAEDAGLCSRRDARPIDVDESGVIKELQLKSSNICNLKCRMCGPWNSTAWQIEDRQNDFKIKKWTGYFFGEEPSSPIKDAHFTDYLLTQVVPGIDMLRISGGEPTLCIDTLNFFKQLLARGLHEKQIRLNTNLTKLRALGVYYPKFWKKFPNLKILVSCDGSNSNVEYTRSGLNYAKLKENMLKVKEQIASVRCTLSIYSVYSIPDLLHDLYKEGIFLGFDNVAQSFMSIQSLPTAEKVKIKKYYYGQFQEMYRKKYNVEIMLGLKNSILDFMFHVDLDPELNNKKFKKMNEEIDKRRGTQFAQGCPQLASWYEPLRYDKDVQQF